MQQVRASLAQLRADNRSRVKLDNASREMREIQRVQQIKADYNDLKHKRAQKVPNCGPSCRLFLCGKVVLP